MASMKVTVILPTLNEIEGLRWFMPRLKKEWYDQLIIIDGNSTDGTIEYCKSNAYPIYLQTGKGLPNALDEAYKRVTGDIIVTVTPDGNSLPELIPALVEKILEGYDMAIASRYAGGAKSEDDDPMTAFGNRMFTFLINLFFGGHLTDSLVGMRAYTKAAAEKMQLYDQGERYWLRRRFCLTNSWETGSSIRSSKLKLKVCDVPGDEPKRIGGVRKMSIIKNGFGTVFQILHELMIGKSFSKSKQ